MKMKQVSAGILTVLISIQTTASAAVLSDDGGDRDLRAEIAADPALKSKVLKRLKDEETDAFKWSIRGAAVGGAAIGADLAIQGALEKRRQGLEGLLKQGSRTKDTTTGWAKLMDVVSEASDHQANSGKLQGLGNPTAPAPPVTIDRSTINDALRDPGQPYRFSPMSKALIEERLVENRHFKMSSKGLLRYTVGGAALINSILHGIRYARAKSLTGEIDPSEPSISPLVQLKPAQGTASGDSDAAQVPSQGLIPTSAQTSKAW